MENIYETNLLPVEDYDSLDECQEATGCYNNGDYIVDSFYNGNWNEGVQFMLDECIHPRDLANYLEEKEEEFGEKIYKEFLDRAAFITITELWYEMKGRL